MLIRQGFLFVLLFFTQWLWALPGPLSKVPLGLQNPIPPNLMLLYDSSGSMDYTLIESCSTAIQCESYYDPRYGSWYSGPYNVKEDYEYRNGYLVWGDREFYNCRQLPEPRTGECPSSRRYIAERVANQLIDDIDGFYVSLMRFNRSSTYNYAGGVLLKSPNLIANDDPQTKQAYQQTISDIEANGATPLAESLGAIADYFSLAAPQQPILTPSQNFVMTLDTDDPNYNFVPTLKSSPFQVGRDALFYNQLLTNYSGVTPVFDGAAASDIEKNENMVIKGWCQKNFNIVLTDGEPSRDDDLRDLFRRYERTSQSDYLVNVAGALWDMDLRADLCDKRLLKELNDEYGVNMTDCIDLITTRPAGNPLTVYELLEQALEQSADDNLLNNDTKLHRYKNNIRTYIIGFADSSVTENTLMQTAARVGGGKYFGAENGDQLQAVFNTILNDINSITSSSSGVGLSLTAGAGGDFMFRSTYDTQDWSGELRKYEIIRQVGTVDLDSQTPEWSTEDPETFASVDDRVIYTWDAAVQDGVPLRWASLSADHIIRQDLAIAPNGNTDTLAEDRLDFLRGDQSREISNAGGIFRARSSLLGDIVHSTPKFVSSSQGGLSPDNIEVDTSNFLSDWNASITQWSESNPYVSVARKQDIVYVNANDGMLHAFNATNGKELFAYLPSFLASTTPQEGLHYLTDPAYIHRFYNDATPYIDEDVWVSSKNKWRSLLVSGTAAGGKGLFLLDVSNLQTINDSKADNIVMWEFTHPDLGYTYAEPYIGPLANGQWAVVIGNGYDSESGIAKVFIILVEPDLTDGWQEGEDYYVISTGVGSSDDTVGMGKNGMSTVVALDVFQDIGLCEDKLYHVYAEPCFEGADPLYFKDGYGSIDRLYGGDLHGNLWAFNLVSPDPDDWHVDFAGQPLFKTPITDGFRQPITAAPRVIDFYQVGRCDAAAASTNGIFFDEFGDMSKTPFSQWDTSLLPETDVERLTRGLTCGPNTLIMFGTGQFLAEDDVVNTKANSFYTIWDNHKASSYPLLRSDLDRRNFTTEADGSDELKRTIADNDGLAENESPLTQWHRSDEFGWFVNFDQIGERQVSSPFFFYKTGEVFFTTIIPEDEACGFGGISMMNRLDAVKGLASENDRSNVIYVGTELFGLASAPQIIGNDGPETPDMAIFGGTGISMEEAAKPPIATRGILSQYEVKQ